MLSDWAGTMNGLANCGFPVKTPQESAGESAGEGENIDTDTDPAAPSSDTVNGAELDWAHGYGRGQ